MTVEWAMHILFIHGMGRTPLSGLPVLWRLSRNGHTTSSFGYWTAFQDFHSIRNRLRQRLAGFDGMAYAVFAHSLGGVLLRSALEDPRIPQPQQVFLLGSPVVSSRRARLLQNRVLYKVLAGDCGQMLASEERMAAIGPLAMTTTSIVGTRGLPGQWGPFQGEPNDGIVAVSEVAASWITEEIRVPLVHTLLPSSRLVSKILLERLGGGDRPRSLLRGQP